MFWLVLLPVLAILLLLASYMAFRTAFYNPIPHREDPYQLPDSEQYEERREHMLALVSQMDAIAYEPVQIRSYDGLTLFGRYYHVQDGAPLQIQFHGYRGTALRDFCGGNKIAREAGLNTLVIDQRAHGKSDGTVISMGVNERLDCLAWARYAANRFGPYTPITLAGVSMGAATVLMASDLELPENVKGIIADCPYSSPEAIIRVVIRRMGLPVFLAYPLLSLGTRLFGSFCLNAASVVESVTKTSLPILLIHGEDDRYVPCEMSLEIAQAGGDKVTLATFPGAGHGLSFIVDEERYRTLVTEFLEEVQGVTC